MNEPFQFDPSILMGLGPNSSALHIPSRISLSASGGKLFLGDLIDTALFDVEQALNDLQTTACESLYLPERVVFQAVSIIPANRNASMLYEVDNKEQSVLGVDDHPDRVGGFEFVAYDLGRAGAMPMLRDFRLDDYYVAHDTPWHDILGVHVTVSPYANRHAIAQWATPPLRVCISLYLPVKKLQNHSFEEQDEDLCEFVRNEYEQELLTFNGTKIRDGEGKKTVTKWFTAHDKQWHKAGIVG